MDRMSGPRRMRPAWRSLVRGLRLLGTVAGICVATLVLLEVTLRAVPSLIPPDALRIFNADVRTRIAARRGLISALNVEYMQRDDGGPPHRLWRFRPRAAWGRTRMDDMGFCNLPADKYVRESTFRIVTIGDSFTFCWNVAADSAWPALLDPLLHATVYNLGLPDMGIHEEIQLLARFGLEKQPQTVVIGFYEGNDLRDAVKVQAYRSSVDTGPEGPPDAFGRVRASLPRRVFYSLMDAPPARWSYAYNLGVAGLGLIVQRLTERRAESTENFRYRVVVGGRTIAMNSDNADSDELEWARALDAGRVALDVLADALTEFVRLAASSAFVPVVAYMPSAHTVYRSSVVFDDPHIARLMDTMHATQIAYLQRMADSLRYRFVDLTAPLMEAALDRRDGELLYYANDLHMTPIAHEVVARHLASALESVLTRSPHNRRGERSPAVSTRP